MARQVFPQGPSDARWRLAVRPLQELTVALFELDRDPRIHPRIFYLGATAVVARLEQWRDGLTLTYGALMMNNTVRLGHHVPGWPPPSPPAPMRPACNSQTAPTCVEYAVTPLGIVGTHDNRHDAGVYEPQDWDIVDRDNFLGIVLPRQYLLDTSPESDVFSEPALGAQALAAFAGHIPPILEQAIMQFQRESGQAPAA